MSTITNIQTQALKCFAGGRYGECLTHLQKLKSTASHKYSLSVQQNIALVEFLQSQQSQPQRLSEELAKLMHRAADPKEGSSRSSEKGKTEVIPSYAAYNRAVILYHMRRYDESLSILEALLMRKDQLNYIISVHTCFLLIQIYLLEYKQLDRIPKLLSSLEEIVIQNHSFIESAKSAASSSPHTSSDSRLSLEADLTQMSPYSKDPENYIRYYRAVMNYMKGKSPEPIHQLELIPNESITTQDTFSIAVNMFKAREYSRSANQMLSRAGREEVDDFIILNNIGCIYFQQKKYALACLHFAKALLNMDSANQTKEASPKPESSSPWTMGVFFQSRQRKHEVMYNLGLQHFLLGQYDMALPYLRACLEKRRNDPGIWLRISECCIGSYFSKKNVHLQTQTHQTLHPFFTILGSGQHRRVKITHGQEIHMMSEMNTMEHMKPTSLLSYAIECTLSCIGIISRLFPALEASQSALHLSFAASKSMSDDGLRMYRSAVIMLPYLYLEIGDATSALFWCKVANSLHIKETLDKSLILMYMGEALCLLNRTEESQKCLLEAAEMMASTKSAKVKSEEDEKSCSRLYVPANMVTLLRTNFVVALVLRGDFIAAEKSLNQVLEMHPNFVPALLMFCFLNLRKGNKAVVLDTLQIRCRNQFLTAQDSK